MIRFLLLGLMAPVALDAQLALFRVDGTVETQISSAVYDLGKAAVGDALDFRFRVRNLGSAPVTLNPPDGLSLNGAGFTLTGAPSLPYTLNPATALDFVAHFDAGPAAVYNAHLIAGTASVFLLITTVPAGIVTGFPACAPTLTTPRGADFGNVPFGKTGSCNFTVSNPYNTPLTVSSISVTGAEFAIQSVAPLPVTIAPGSATPFAVQITPVCGTVNYSGTLTIDSESYPLVATGVMPPFPKPAITFDSPLIASGQQHTLAMNLPSPYPCGATGLVTLNFTSGSNLVTNDPAIVFVPSGSRSVPFSVKAGSSQLLLDGQAAATFQTGTTEGAIKFTVTASGLENAADANSILTIAPALVSIQVATASNQRAGSLDISVTGFDNTYTAGQMSFTFFDPAGKPIGNSPIAADFRPGFSGYFTTQPGGSAFLVRVSFPVTGTPAQLATIASVEVTLTNAAGQVKTGSLPFQ